MTWTKALSDELERRLVVDYEDGFRPVDLVRRYRVSSSTVYRILSDYGAKRKIEPQLKRTSKRAQAKGRTLQPCGTNAAYVRHKRNGEYPCTPCLEAHAADQARRNYERSNPKALGE